jgi:hypothetical protein
MNRFIMLLLLAAALTLPACTLEEQQTHSSLTGVRQDLQALTAAIQGTPDTATEQVNEVKGQIGQVLDKLDTVAGAVADVEEARAAGEDPGPAVAEGAKTVGGLLPPPIGDWVGLVGVLAGAVASAVFRRKQQAAEAKATATREDAKTIARAVEAAKDAAGNVYFGDDATVRTLETVMTPGARAIVREARTGT